MPDTEAPVVDAHTVGADQEQASLPRHLRDLFLQRDTILSLRFRETRREERDCADFFLDAIGNDAGRDWPGHRADDVIDVVGDFAQALVVENAHCLDA